jgi:hypothetical protein
MEEHRVEGVEAIGHREAMVAEVGNVEEAILIHLLGGGEDLF